MSDFLFLSGRDVKYFRYNTKEWVDATIVGPSTSSGGYIKLKYMRGVLRRWLWQRRTRRVLVTKRMLIRKVKELSLKLRELTPKQLEDWWSGFRRRRHISARRVTSYRRGMDEVVLPLVRCYRAVLHGYRVWGTNGGHTVYRPHCPHYTLFVGIPPCARNANTRLLRTWCTSLK